MVCAITDGHDALIHSDGGLYLNFEQDETSVRRAFGLMASALEMV